MPDDDGGLLRVLDGPAVGHALSRLRERRTEPPEFRRQARAMGALLAAAAVSDIPEEGGLVETPIATAATVEPAVDVVVVPVLRAGLGLLTGVLDVMPMATVGMVVLQRDEESLEPIEYYRKMPALEDAWVLVLEPMLATGGSATAAVGTVAAPAAQVIVLSVVATEVAIARIHDTHPGTRIVTAAVDPELDDDAFIVPGLGDFGDRLYGTTA